MPNTLPGKLLSPEYDAQLRQVVRNSHTDARSSNLTRRTRRSLHPSRFPEYAVILDAPLPAATNFKTGATKARATVVEWNISTEIYSELDLQLEVWNHSESTGYEADTPGIARFINGHYWFLGDCEPMSDRDGTGGQS